MDREHILHVTLLLPPPSKGIDNVSPPDKGIDIVCVWGCVCVCVMSVVYCVRASVQAS